MPRMPLLAVLATAAFAGSLSVRLTDPIVPQLARDFSVSIATTALLASAFNFPYAFAQPLLGPLGDALGKARIMKYCLAVMTIALVGSALAASYEQLFIARILTGVAAGGTMPIAFAAVADRFPYEERQVALMRVVMAAMSGQLIGSVGTGLVAELIGWRAVMIISAVAAAGSVIVVATQLKPRPGVQRREFSVAGVLDNYRTILRNPRAAVCYPAVFCEGAALFGLPPFIAPMLEASGRGSVKEAGFILAGLGLGGIIYALSVQRLLRLLGSPFIVMRAGGFVCASGLLIASLQPPWGAQVLAFTIIGGGFFMIHNPIQTESSELAPSARGSAMSLHAFCFFMGMASGPVVYGALIAAIGAAASLRIAAILILLIAFAASWGLKRLASRPH